MSDDDDENISKFPPVPAIDENKNYTSKQKWQKTKENIKQERKPTHWNTLHHLISATPSNAKSFLGVEEGKSLVNWEERALKVFRSNRIFGGKIKDEAVEEYLNSLQKHGQVEQTDPLSMLENERKKNSEFLNYYCLRYKMTGGAKQNINAKQNESVINITYKRAKSLFRKVS